MRRPTFPPMAPPLALPLLEEEEEAFLPEALLALLASATLALSPPLAPLPPASFSLFLLCSSMASSKVFSRAPSLVTMSTMPPQTSVDSTKMAKVAGSLSREDQSHSTKVGSGGSEDMVAVR